MLVYVATYLFLFFGGFINTINRNKKSLLFFLIIFLLICHDGLRWETGTDWTNYYNAFERCLMFDFDDFESGYVFLMRCFRVFTDNYTAFLLFHAAFVYILMAIILWKYSPMPVLSLFFLYSCLILQFHLQQLYIFLLLYNLKLYFHIYNLHI